MYMSNYPFSPSATKAFFKNEWKLSISKSCVLPSINCKVAGLITLPKKSND